MGLAWAAVASSTTRASPAAKDSSRIPISVAAAGNGVSPRTMLSMPSRIFAIDLPSVVVADHDVAAALCWAGAYDIGSASAEVTAALEFIRTRIRN
jgi:hypothetical protein